MELLQACSQLMMGHACLQIQELPSEDHPHQCFTALNFGPCVSLQLHQPGTDSEVMCPPLAPWGLKPVTGMDL